MLVVGGKCDFQSLFPTKPLVQYLNDNSKTNFDIIAIWRGILPFIMASGDFFLTHQTYCCSNVLFVSTSRHVAAMIELSPLHDAPRRDESTGHARNHEPNCIALAGHQATQTKCWSRSPTSN